MKNQTLGAKLKYFRTLKGLSQEELAFNSTVGIRTIQRIEKDEVQPHLQTLRLLSESLEISINDLKQIDNPNEEKIQRKWMLLLHGTPFLGFVIPFGNILFPLFLWIHKSDDNKIYDSHGRSIVNFHSSIVLYFLISLLLFFVFPGYNFFLTGAIILFAIISTILNLTSALNSGTCNYPLSIPFLKKQSV